MAHRLVGLLAIGLGVAAAQGVPGLARDGHAAAVIDQAAEEPARSDTLFTFHSSFWLNLHHFLYEQAIFAADASTRRLPRNARQVSLDPLSGYERSVLKAAVAFYRDSVIERSLLFNRRLGEIDRELGALEQTGSVRGQLGWRALEELLDEAAPVYEAYWWPKHDKANQAHIAGLEPLVAEYGDAIAARMIVALQVEWPDDPIRVDIVEFANWAGAYTRPDPTRIVISSTEGRGDELGSLETVFHEAGHGMIGRTRGPVSEAIGRAFTNADKDPPRPLWHPILFYTVGEIVIGRLAEAEIDYVPYADRHGLYTGDWGKAHTLLVRYWPAYLAGESSLDAALDSIAADW